MDTKAILNEILEAKKERKQAQEVVDQITRAINGTPSFSAKIFIISKNEWVIQQEAKAIRAEKRGEVDFWTSHIEELRAEMAW